MNDLQAQLEEVSKEKQELQEKVRNADIRHGHASQVKPRGYPETCCPHYGVQVLPYGECKAVLGDTVHWNGSSVASSSVPGQLEGKPG